MNLILLKVSLFVSVVFSFLTMLIHYDNPLLLQQTFLFYIVVGFLYNVLEARDSRFRVLAVGLLAPLLFSFTWVYALLVVLSALTLAFLVPTTQTAYFKEFRYIIKRIFFAVIALIIFKLNFFFIGMDLIAVSPYLITELIAMVLTLRSMRLAEANMASDKLKQHHKRSFFAMMVALIMVNIGQVRAILYGLAQTLVSLLPEGVFNVLHRALNRAFAAVVAWIFGGDKVDEGLDFIFSSPLLAAKPDTVEDVQKAVEQLEQAAIGEKLPVMEWVLFGILICVLVGGLFTIFKKMSKRSKSDSSSISFSEEREFVKLVEDKKKKKSLFGYARKPKEPLDLLRFAYQHYLKVLLHRQIPIKPWDTTEDIATKAEALGDFELPAKHIRAIYIDGRYGADGVDRETAEALYQTTQKLK